MEVCRTAPSLNMRHELGKSDWGHSLRMTISTNPIDAWQRRSEQAYTPPVKVREVRRAPTCVAERIAFNPKLNTTYAATAFQTCRYWYRGIWAYAATLMSSYAPYAALTQRYSTSYVKLPFSKLPFSQPGSRIIDVAV